MRAAWLCILDERSGAPLRAAVEQRCAAERAFGGGPLRLVGDLDELSETELARWLRQDAPAAGSVHFVIVWRPRGGDADPARWLARAEASVTKIAGLFQQTFSCEWVVAVDETAYLGADAARVGAALRHGRGRAPNAQVRLDRVWLLTASNKASAAHAGMNVDEQGLDDLALEATMLCARGNLSQIVVNDEPGAGADVASMGVARLTYEAAEARRVASCQFGARLVRALIEDEPKAALDKPTVAWVRESLPVAKAGVGLSPECVLKALRCPGLTQDRAAEPDASSVLDKVSFEGLVVEASALARPIERSFDIPLVIGCHGEYMLTTQLRSALEQIEQSRRRLFDALAGELRAACTGWLNGQSRGAVKGAREQLSAVRGELERQRLLLGAETKESAGTWAARLRERLEHALKGRNKDRTAAARASGHAVLTRAHDALADALEQRMLPAAYLARIIPASFLLAMTAAVVAARIPDRAVDLGVFGMPWVVAALVLTGGVGYAALRIAQHRARLQRLEDAFYVAITERARQLLLDRVIEEARALYDQLEALVGKDVADAGSLRAAVDRVETSLETAAAALAATAYQPQLVETRFSTPLLSAEQLAGAPFLDGAHSSVEPTAAATRWVAEARPLAVTGVEPDAVAEHVQAWCAEHGHAYLVEQPLTFTLGKLAAGGELRQKLADYARDRVPPFLVTTATTGLVRRSLAAVRPGSADNVAALTDAPARVSREHDAFDAGLVPGVCVVEVALVTQPQLAPTLDALLRAAPPASPQASAQDDAADSGWEGL